jgi:tRNA pseudouridine55 synthase
LALACGRATRLVRFLMSSDKEYVASVRFGMTTDTYDMAGAEVARADRVPLRTAIEEALGPLRGSYAQVPPPFSAKKVAGERAYARARRDEVVALAAVPVRVTRAELLDYGDGVARVAITCSAGFYVRSFAHELGRAVGTGACLAGLRRTRSGDFTLDDAVQLEDLGSTARVLERWIPLDRLLPAFPAVRLLEQGVSRVLHGQEVLPAHASEGREWPTGGDTGVEHWVRLTDAKGRLLALATPGKAVNSLHPAVVLT